MQTFICLNDLEDWLEPLSYEEFWEAIIPHCVSLPRRCDCDGRITRGILTEDQILEDLKYSVVMELAKRYNFQWEDKTPLLYG